VERESSKPSWSVYRQAAPPLSVLRADPLPPSFIKFNILGKGKEAPPHGALGYPSRIKIKVKVQRPGTLPLSSQFPEI
jgi:hypothetical protein